MKNLFLAIVFSLTGWATSGTAAIATGESSCRARCLSFRYRAASVAPSPNGAIPQNDVGHRALQNPAEVSGSALTGLAHAEFLVRDGDTWVLVGDSITEQKLHTTYLEAFIRARYPQLKFIAVNSGRSGNSFQQGVIRYRRSVAAYRPTLVSVEFGMNDHRKWFPQQPDFLNNPTNHLQRFADLTKATGARLAIFSPSPYNLPPAWGDGPVFDRFVEQLKIFAATNRLPYLDQYKPLQTLWAGNFARDRAAAFNRDIAATNSPAELIIIAQRYLDGATLTRLLGAPPNTNPADFLDLPDKDTLIDRFTAARRGPTQARDAFQKYLQSRPTTPTGPIIGTEKSWYDVTHPGPVGQLLMAALLFREMGGAGLVSSVSVDARSLRAESTQATVRNITFNAGTLRFQRLDESLPLPVPAAARGALALAPDLFGLSRYLLTVTNLPAGRYEVLVDDARLFTASAAELAQGVDAGLLANQPATRVLEAVTAKLVVADTSNGVEVKFTGTPYTLPEAQPVEHTWTVRPLP